EPGPGRLVEAEQIPLGVALDRPEDLVEARELEVAPAGHRLLLRPLARRRRGRRLLRGGGRGRAVLGAEVLAQAHEGRLAQEARGRHLRGAHLADALRAHKADPAQRPRRRAAEGGLRHARALELVGERVRGPRVEAGADAPREDELLAAPPREQEGAEARPRATARREPDDREAGAARGLDLEPALRAARRLVARVRALRDDALESARLRGLEERAAVALDVVGKAHEAAARDDSREELLAVRERHPAQVVAEGREQVEGEEDDRDLLAQRLHRLGVALGEAALEPLEGAPARRVERDDL